MKTIRGITAIGLAGFLAVSAAKPANAQFQVLAPAACATGVGCVLVGAAVAGGIVYWVWQNSQTGERRYNRIEDPEEEARAMGGGYIQDQVIAGRQIDAERQCRQKLGSRYKETRWAHSNRWDCIGY